MSFVCVDRTPDLIYADTVADVAVRINPANRGGRPAGTPLEAAGVPTFFWLPGSTLRIRFLDGTPALHRRVMAAAGDWTHHANLHFVQVRNGDAEIRVTFNGTGNWSALGTQAAVPELYPPDAPTMCLADVPTSHPKQAGGIIRHEFGHAIGLIHEHSSPASGIRWNKAAVYRDLGGWPNFWPPEKVEYQVFVRYAASTTQYTSFDPNSIMIYEIPASWTLDRRSYPENTELSATDRAFVAAVYPHPPR